MEKQNDSARCTLCPALCELRLGWRGPDLPRVGYPAEAGSGVCSRGSALGELIASPRRIRWPRRREPAGLTDAVLPDAVNDAARRMVDGATVIIDGGSLPVEEIAASAEVAAAWSGVRLCCAVTPEDEQLLLGLEASGATYLADEELDRCDGFVIVGDVFAANPRCARGVLDALRERRQAPVVVIDSGGGVVGSYATLRVRCPAGGEAEALAGDEVASAVGDCRKLGVVLAASIGRGGGWGRLGYLAGKLANDHRGGVCPQTTGANALAAVRAGRELGLVSLAQAMTPSGSGPRVVLGVDVLGLLGWEGPAVPVVAAALPNQTTASAEVVLPLALPCEMGGTFLQAGTRRVRGAALLPPPAGVPTPSVLLRSLALAAGVDVPPAGGNAPVLGRLAASPPAQVRTHPVAGRVLVGARDAIHHAAGELTGAASWQSQFRALPELRLGPADAAELGAGDLDEVEVQTESHRTRMRARVVEHMAGGTLAFAEGSADARRLTPYVIDADGDALVSHPAEVQAVKRAPRRAGKIKLKLGSVRDTTAPGG